MNESEGAAACLEPRALVEIGGREHGEVAGPQLRLVGVEVLLDHDVRGPGVEQEVDEAAFAQVRQDPGVEDSVEAQDAALAVVTELVDFLCPDHRVGRQVIVDPRRHLAAGGKVPRHEGATQVGPGVAEFPDVDAKIGHEREEKERRSGDAQAGRNPGDRRPGGHGNGGEARHEVPLAVGRRHHDGIERGRDREPGAESEGQGAGFPSAERGCKACKSEQTAGGVGTLEKANVFEVHEEGAVASRPLPSELDPGRRGRERRAEVHEEPSGIRGDDGSGCAQCRDEVSGSRLAVPCLPREDRSRRHRQENALGPAEGAEAEEGAAEDCASGRSRGLSRRNVEEDREDEEDEEGRLHGANRPDGERGCESEGEGRTPARNRVPGQAAAEGGGSHEAERGEKKAEGLREQDQARGPAEEVEDPQAHRPCRARAAAGRFSGVEVEELAACEAARERVVDVRIALQIRPEGETLKGENHDRGRDEQTAGNLVPGRRQVAREETISSRHKAPVRHEHPLPLRQFPARAQRVGDTRP